MRKNIRDKNAIIKRVDWKLMDKIPNGTTLQDCLQKVHNDGHSSTVIKTEFENLELMHCQSVDGCFVGVLAIYETGKSVEVIKVDKKTNAKKISAVNLADGEKLESALYFCVEGDRVSIVQSAKLRSKALEGHINALIKKSYPTCEGLVMLLDEIPEDIAALIRKVGVKQIRFGQAIYENKAGVAKIAQGLFGSKIKESWAKKLGSGLSDARYSGLKSTVVVELTGRKKPEESINLLKALAIGLSNDLDGVTLELLNQKKLKNNELITWRKMHVAYTDGVPTLTQMFSALRSALQPIVVKH
jgi:hypothetical protein